MISGAMEKLRKESLAVLRQGLSVCINARVHVLTDVERQERIKAIAQLTAIEAAVMRANTDKELVTALEAARDQLSEDERAARPAKKGKKRR
jgi:hypothetical protein